MIKSLTNAVHSLTMYRLTLIGLAVLAAWSMLISAFGKLPFAVLPLALSILVLLAACYATNSVLAKLFRAPTNVESALITALILFFVMAPAVSAQHALFLIASGAVAMASKYILAIRKKHLFNPAAISAVVFTAFTNYGSTWWVGSEWMLPAVALVGFLIVKKIRHVDLFISCAAAALATVLAGALITDRTSAELGAIADLIVPMLVNWPTVFFIAIMVTEPLTTPPTKKLRIAYGLIIGCIYASGWRLGPLYATPEVALIVGNIFSYAVSPKYKLFVRLVKHVRLAPDTHHFSFSSPTNITFKPGQYLEWTLPHRHPDNRGNRRFFTIASSPQEKTIDIGVVIGPKASSFKRALRSMKPEHTIVAAQLGGDFVLPDNPKTKLVFIAGGIGITPFRSMLYHLTARNQRRDIILLYTCRSAADFVYKDVFDRAAKQLGITIAYIITDPNKAPAGWREPTGYLTPERIKKYVPDYPSRTFYLSGPEAMVVGYKKMLRQTGVPAKKIITDYFPGY